MSGLCKDRVSKPNIDVTFFRFKLIKKIVQTISFVVTIWCIHFMPKAPSTFDAQPYSICSWLRTATSLLAGRGFYFESITGNTVSICLVASVLDISWNGKLTAGEKFSACTLPKSSHSHLLGHGKPSEIAGRGFYRHHKTWRLGCM